MKEKSRISVERIISLLLVFSPYVFTIGKTISIGYWVILFLIIDTLFFKNRNIIKVNVLPILLVFVMIIISLISLTLTEISPVNNILTRNFQYVVWAVFLAILPMMDLDAIQLHYSIVSLAKVGSIYLYLQIIMNAFFGYRLPNVINLVFLKAKTLDLRTLTIFRPASFYEEPSYFALQLLIAISLLLFLKNKNREDKRLLLFFTITMFFTTSSSGIYLMFLIYVLKSLNKKGFFSLIYALFTFFLILLILRRLPNLLPKLGTLGNTIDHAFKKIKYIDSSTRVGKSYNYLDNLQGVHRYLGHGIGNEFFVMNNQVTYINSITRLILQTGKLGLLVVILFLCILIVKSKTMLSFTILSIYILKSFTGGTLFSISGIYLLLVYWSLGKEKYIYD